MEGCIWEVKATELVLWSAIMESYASIHLAPLPSLLRGSICSASFKRGLKQGAGSKNDVELFWEEALWDVSERLGNGLSLC